MDSNSDYDHSVGPEGIPGAIDFSDLPLVSIIVVNYNGLEHIEGFFNSLATQTYPNYETILVDNASTDQSHELASSILPTLKVVRNSTNLGYAGGVNSGLPFVTGNFVVVQNTDTLVDDAWLTSMMHVMLSHRHVGAVTPQIVLDKDRTRLNAMGMVIHLSGLGFNRGLNTLRPTRSLAAHRVSGVHGASFLIRKNLLESLGGMNSHSFMYYDDVDLSWMVNLTGYQIYCAPNAVVYHKYELKMNPLKFYYLERNRWFLLLSTLGPIGFLLTAPALLATEFLTFSYAILKGPKYLRAKLKAFLNLRELLPAIAQRRALLRDLRTVPDWQVLRGYSVNYTWSQLLHISRSRGQGKRSELV